MSTVYDDIAARLDAEQQSITDDAAAVAHVRDAAISDAGAERDKAYAEADSVYQDAANEAAAVFTEGMAPLTARAQEVEAIRTYLNVLATQAAADPQVPSAEGDATTSASDDAPAQPSEPQPEPSTQPDAASTPTPEPEPTPSTESGDASSAPEPTASPESEASEAPAPITIDALVQNLDVPEDTPVQVTLSTGQMAVVPASDVLAAADPEKADEALTTTQLDLRRNSDFP